MMQHLSPRWGSELTSLHRTAGRRRSIIAITLVVAVLGLVVGVHRPHKSLIGVDWPNAGRVYVAHWNQQSVRGNNPAVAFRAAKKQGIHVIRVILGDDVVISRWRVAPSDALAAIQRMLDDAAASGIRLIITNYLTLEAIGALAGRSYASLQVAQRDITTPNSPAWRGFEDWLHSVVPRFADHRSVYSWEVVNEPGTMLGVDNGGASPDAGIAFLDTFQNGLHQLGAKRVNGGGTPSRNPDELSEAQVRRYAAHLDVLDAHLYASVDLTGKQIGDEAGAEASVAEVAQYFARVKSILGRPTMPVMLGEVGSAPQTWFERAVASARARGWLVLIWGYDAYDQYDFTAVSRPEVLHYAGRVNGCSPLHFAVFSLDASCRLPGS
jgi:hypothetical protein